ncbi:MAG: hypothetical protein KTR31_03885 [Myxococcales bacterium]|nr:hypothetical protein [Myxococcales bacterium]
MNRLLIGTLTWSVLACTAEPTETAVLPETDTEDTPETTEDSGTPPDPTIGPTDVTFVVTGDVTGMGISVQYTGSGAIVSAPLTGPTHTFTLEERPNSELFTLEVDGEQIRIGFYSTAIHEDDGDGVPEPGEVYASVGPSLIFVPAEFDGSPILADFGWTIGWNLLGFGTLSAVPMTIHEPSDAVTISGSYEATDAPRLAVAPTTWLDDGTFGTLLYDEPLPKSWTITLSGAPPAEHQLSGDPELPDGTALQLPFTYTDADESGSFSKGDVRLDELSLCSRDDPRGVRLAWFPRSDDLFHNLLVTDGQSGWHLVEVDEDGDLRIPFDPMDNEGVVIGPCKPPS